VEDEKRENVKGKGKVNYNGKWLKMSYPEDGGSRL
jgi:hypothetical protein